MIQVGDLAKITQSTNTGDIGRVCIVLKNHCVGSDVFWIQILETGTKDAYHQSRLSKLGDQK